MDYRFATREDTRMILQFIKELADYEQMLNEVIADEKLLEEWIFDKVDIREGIPVISLKGLLEMKKSLGREKDLEDIKLIEKKLSN